MNQPQTPRQVVYTPVDPDAISDGDYQEFKTEEEIEFEKFRDEMRESNEYAKVTVYRQPMTGDNQPGAKKLIFLFECGIDEFSFSQICGKLRDEYGSGTYRIQARNDKGKMQMNRSVTIEAPQVETDGKERPTSAGVIIDRFSAAMDANTERTERMLARMMPQSNPMSMMTEMATAMATIMGTFQGQQTQPKSMLDQLTEFKMLQELFSGGDSGGGSESNLFSLLTETVKSFGPAIGLAIASQQKAGAIPASGPIQPLLPNPEPETKTLSKELEEMRPQINFLCAQAKAGAKPGDVAAALIPGIPETALESIEAFLQQENVIDICAQVNSDVNAHRMWFTEWREIMLKTLAEILVDELPPEADHPLSEQVLTLEPEQEQTSDSDVAGDDPIKEGATDETLSASEPSADTSDTDGVAAGNSGDARDS